MVSLHSLPEELIGAIFALLPDAKSKRAFFESSHAVHQALSVTEQITTAVVPLSKFDASLCEDAPSHCSLNFPRASQLRELVICGSSRAHYTRDHLEDSWLTVKLLRPEDESMHAKAQHIERITLKDFYFGGGFEKEVPQLGKLLGTLPNLQVLRVDGSVLDGRVFKDTLPPAFIRAFSAAAAAPSDACRLKELHCEDLDDRGIQAVSCLRSLESLSFRLNAAFSHNINPLSSLSALKHLHIRAGICWGTRSGRGMETLLPHLQSLNSLKLNNMSSSLFTALPQSLRLIDIDPAPVKMYDMCRFLDRFVAGRHVPSSPLQLRFFRLGFRDLNEPKVQALSEAIASHLSVCPSLSLVVERVENAPSPAVLFECISYLPQLTHNLTSVRSCTDVFYGLFDADDLLFEETIAPNDLAHLAKLLPHLRGLEVKGFLFQDLQTSLNVVAGSFPFLSRLDMTLMADKQPGYAPQVLSCLTALASNQERCGRVVDVHISLCVDEEDRRELEKRLCDLYMVAKELEREWWCMRATLPGGGHDVRFSAEIFSFAFAYDLDWVLIYRTQFGH